MNPWVTRHLEEQRQEEEEHIVLSITLRRLPVHLLFPRGTDTQTHREIDTASTEMHKYRIPQTQLGSKLLR